MLSFIDFFLTVDENLLSGLDLVVQSIEQVTVESDRVEDYVLVGISLQVRRKRGRIDLLVLDVCAANLWSTCGKRWSGVCGHSTHLALVCGHLLSNSKLNYN